MKTTRRRARRVTLETLYEYDLAEHEPLAVLARHAEERPLERSTHDFARHLVKGVVSNQAQIDTLIIRFAPEWPLDQMAYIDRNILRIAIFEFLIDTKTPIKVAINEAVELAKIYGSDSAPRFINGVLGTLADQVPELRDEIAAAEELARAPLAGEAA